MESFTIELVSNASSQLFPDNTLSSFTNFLPSQVNLEGQWEVAISEISYPSMYQNITVGKFMYTHKEYEKGEALYLEPGLYSSITDIVEAMNNCIQNKFSLNKPCIEVKVFRSTQKIELTLENETSSLVLLSPDLIHIFGISTGNESGIWMRGKGPHKPPLEYDIVRIHSLMIYSDIVEYSMVGDSKAPLLRSFPYISKVKSGDILTTGQYMNYQTFNNLQYRRLLKSSFQSIHIDVRDTSGEKIPFVSVGITRLVLMFRKVSDYHY